MALSNPQRIVVEAEMASGVTGKYGLIYQLVPSADGAKLMAKAYATSPTDGNSLPIIGVIECPSGKEPDSSGPKTAAVPGDAVSFVIAGTVRTLVHIETSTMAQNAELYIHANGHSTASGCLVNNIADSDCATASGNLDSAAKLIGFVSFVRGQ